MDIRALVAAGLEKAGSAAALGRIAERTAWDDRLSPLHAARMLARHGLIAEDEAQALAEAPGRPQRGPSTLLRACFEAHPSTVRDRRRPRGHAERHAAALEQFIEWSGITDAGEVRLGLVEDWVEELRRRGDRYYTRVHRLVPIKRAMAYAARISGRNPLAGQRLDRDDEHRQVQAYSLDELLRILEHLRDAGDARMLAAASLMGCMGLRPSECLRLRSRDIRGGLLVVGAVAAKNSASRRTLPIPEPLQAVLADATAGNAPEDPVIQSEHRARRGRPMLAEAFSGLWRRRTDAMGLRYLPPKALRKSFFTASVLELGLDPMRVEQWMGHAISGITSVSAGHYLGQAAPRWLLPISEEWAKVVTPVLIPSTADR